MNNLFKKSLLALAVTASAAGTVHASPFDKISPFDKGDRYFKRIATFPIFTNLDANKGDAIEDETAAEIAAASADGNVVYYSDSPKERIGLIDITRPANPMPAGFVELSGEPTSVAVKGKYLLAGINTSNDFTNPSGKLAVYSLANPLQPQWIADLDMGGQPDSVAISPDGKYAAIVVENERDEDYNDGLIPQLPPGHLMVVTMAGDVTDWKVRKVELTGLAEIAPSDPEPEYVAISRWNIAAVTMQENNHIALVDLRKAQVINDFSAGSVDLFNIDTEEDDVINPVDTILDRKREPDAITWVKDWWLATANEGDYEDENGEEGGSRGFTIYNPLGGVKYESGASLEHAIIRAGHYPESRSENKGNEPEAVTYSRYGHDDFLFVGSERANVVAVYELKFGKPQLQQLLPTSIAPEGILTIPERNLLVVSSEGDEAENGFRSTVSVFKYGAKKNQYPQIESDPKQLIPWGALSGMVGDIKAKNTVYAVQDSYYAQSRFFKVNVKKKPAMITEAVVLSKEGETVDYDLEGIAQRADGSFWLASEGAPGDTANLLIHVSANGEVLQEVALPEDVAAKEKKHGFEGVAVTGSGANEKVYVAFQRAWVDDPADRARIGVYTPADGSWAFYYYPLDAAPEGWVGLSEISTIDDNTFAIIERDNQQGNKAAIKKLYKVSIEGLTPVAEGGEFPVLSKTLAKDLLPELQAGNGWVVDKIEGTAITAKGNVYVVSDNDGVDDASGETRFMRLGKLFK